MRALPAIEGRSRALWACVDLGKINCDGKIEMHVRSKIESRSSDQIGHSFNNSGIENGTDA